LFKFIDGLHVISSDTKSVAYASELFLFFSG